jgi:hypothetical protein
VATPRDLERYMKYSSYIHVLNLSTDNDETCRLLEMADRFVFQLNLNDSHFAKLLSLIISPSRFMESQNYLKMRGNRFIQCLKVFLPDMEQGPWFEEIGRYYSGISSLEIYSLGAIRAPISFRSKFSVVVDGLVCLQVLKMDIEPDTISTLLPTVRNLPLLKYLTLRISVDSPEQDRPFEEWAVEPPREPVKVLQLEYEGRPRKNLRAILSISNSLSIYYSSIYCISAPFARPSEMEAMLGWITVNSPGIQTLTLSDRMRPFQWVVDGHIRANSDTRTVLAILPCVLSHLAGLHRLQSLTLGTFSGTVLSPELLETLATSLKSLESCVFRPLRLVDDEGISKCSVSLTDVINFVLQCPNLRYLAVCCDARKSANPPTGSAVFANSAPLTTLEVGQSMIDDSEYVASILQRSLPALRQLIHGPRDFHFSLIMTFAEENIWDDVGRIIMSRQCLVGG